MKMTYLIILLSLRQVEPKKGQKASAGFMTPRTVATPLARGFTTCIIPPLPHETYYSCPEGVLRRIPALVIGHIATDR